MLHLHVQSNEITNTKLNNSVELMLLSLTQFSSLSYQLNVLVSNVMLQWASLSSFIKYDIFVWTDGTKVFKLLEKKSLWDPSKKDNNKNLPAFCTDQS